MQGKYRYNMIIFSSLIERDNVIISIICGDDDAMADVCECLIFYLGSRFSIIYPLMLKRDILIKRKRRNVGIKS